MRTVSANYLKNYYGVCKTLGCPQTHLDTIAPKGEKSLDDPTTRFPIDVVIELLALTKQSTGIDSVGIECGKNFRPESFGLVGQAMMFSKSLRHASGIINRYQPLFQQLGRSYIKIEGEEAWNYWDTYFDDPEIARHATEATMISHAQFGRWLTWKHDMKINFVHFRHKKPACHDEYLGTFDCPIFYDQPRDAVVIDKEFVDLPLPQANQELLDDVCAKLDGALKALSMPRTFTEKTEQYTRVLLESGKADLTETANGLGVSPRSLRRRLADEGTSYRSVLEETRRKLCEQYLLEQRISLGDIAERLGYSEQSAFNRAFKKWFGESPKTYAKAMKVFDTAFDQLAP